MACPAKLPQELILRLPKVARQMKALEDAKKVSRETMVRVITI